MIQELANQCDVRNCLADKVSSTFGSNLVAPITKINFECSCGKVRYLGITCFQNSGTPRKRWGLFWLVFSELWSFKLRWSAFWWLLEELAHIQVTCNLKFRHLIVRWLTYQVDGLDLFCGSDGSASRTGSGPRIVGCKLWCLGGG
jgi:hypothetical protein